MTQQIVIPPTPEVPDSAAAEAEFETTNPALMYLADKAPLTQKSHGNLLSKFARRFFRVWNEATAQYDFGGFDLNDPAQEDEETGADITSANWRQLRAKHVVMCKAWLKGKGLKMATVHAYVSALKGVTRASSQLGIIAADIRLGVDDVKAKTPTDSKKGQRVPLDDVKRLIASCQDDKNQYIGIRDAALISLMVFAGLRRVDCARLKVSGVMKNCTKLSVTGKGMRVDVIPLNPMAVEPLRKWMKLREKWVGKNPDHALFCRVRKGGVISAEEPLSEDGMYGIVRLRVLKAAVADARPHDFRRTFATLLNDKGFPINEIQKLMRHSKIQTTAAYFVNDDEKTERLITEVNFLEK